MTDDSVKHLWQSGMVGMYIGDALAMPVHWYYDRKALLRDYGFIGDYMAPKNPHPDSEMGTYGDAPRLTGIDIFHHQRTYWGKSGVHYHQFLQAGENTLNVKLCTLLVESLTSHQDYLSEDYLRRLIDFMTTPGTHNDTYIDEYLRGFFQNYGAGRPPGDCGVMDRHPSGLIGIVPLILFFHDRIEQGRSSALAHMGLTHKGPGMKDAAEILMSLLHGLMNGKKLRSALLELMGKSDSPLLGHRFDRWLELSDAEVVDEKLGTGCVVEESFPVVLYLALKYHDRPQQGLMANIHLGGNNAVRGALLGALLGTANGLESFPQRWVSGLRHPPGDPFR
jgi:ADP-ribosylglycohydrolase